LKKKKDPTGSLRLRLEFTQKKPELVLIYDWSFSKWKISVVSKYLTNRLF
jgi:hypothetical protein